MLLLYPGNGYKMFGSWQVTEYEGGSECFYSNLTWKPYTSAYSSGYTGGYGGYYDRDVEDTRSNWWDKRKEEKAAKEKLTMTDTESEAIDKKLVEAGFVKTTHGSHVSWALGGKYKEKAATSAIRVWTAEKGDHTIDATSGELVAAAGEATAAEPEVAKT